MSEFELVGSQGHIVVRTWSNDDARLIAVIAHGYGEHSGRYEHVAKHLTGLGAAVYGPDHAGHGRSDGPQALVDNFDTVVSDLRAVIDRARQDRPDRPLVLIGHSMGGLIATRYAQQHADELSALVLSGPLVALNPAFAPLLEMDPIPDVPIDPSTLSRDPEVARRYAEDPLVYHGPFLKQTLMAMGAAIAAIAAGPAFGDVSTLWIHGSEDALAPVEVTRPVVERLAGDHLEAHVYEGARHEILNETNQAEVLEDVTGFIESALASRSA